MTLTLVEDFSPLPLFIKHLESVFEGKTFKEVFILKGSEAVLDPIAAENPY